MIVSLMCSALVLAEVPDPPVSVRVDSGVGAQSQHLEPGPWRAPVSAAASFSLEPRVALGRWQLGIPVLYRSTLRASLVEQAPGGRRPVRMDTFEGALRAERRWTRGMWTLEFGASAWAGRWKLAAPREGRLPDATTAFVRAGIPLRVRRGPVQFTVDGGAGVALQGGAAGPLWAVRADIRVRIAGPFIAAVRVFEDGWVLDESLRTGFVVTGGLGVEVPGLPRRGTMQNSAPQAPLAAPVVASPTLQRPAAPALEGITLKGSKLELRALEGAVVVVDFWASWCGPCRSAMPKLQAFHEGFRDKDVVVLGVSMDEDATDAIAFLREAGVTFESLHDASGALAEAWAPPKMPTTYVIDRRGRIAYVHAGVHEGDDERLQQEVEALLAEPH